jgi:glycerate 2-kinase
MFMKLLGYKIDLPPAAAAVLSVDTETPKSLAEQNTVSVMAIPSLTFAAAAQVATKVGLTPLIFGDAIEGESRELGIVMAGVARSVRLNGLPVKAPAILLSGGETTITIGKGPAGQGGRNTEFLLRLCHSYGWRTGGFHAGGRQRRHRRNGRCRRRDVGYTSACLRRWPRPAHLPYRARQF